MSQFKNNAHIVNSWSLASFAKQFTAVKEAQFVNKDTAEVFTKLAFCKEDNAPVFVQYGQSIPEGFDPKVDLKGHLDQYKVLEMANDVKDQYYVLAKESDSAWQTIDLGI